LEPTQGPHEAAEHIAQLRLPPTSEKIQWLFFWLVAVQITILAHLAGLETAQTITDFALLESGSRLALLSKCSDYLLIFIGFGVTLTGIQLRPAAKVVSENLAAAEMHPCVSSLNKWP
jgi:hypothetical protein